MKIVDPFNMVTHSLGHTHTGKLILEFGGNIAQFRTAHLKWGARDHFEAAQILAQLAKGREKERKDYIEILCNIHNEEGKYKEKKELVEQYQ